MQPVDLGIGQVHGVDQLLYPLHPFGAGRDAGEGIGERLQRGGLLPSGGQRVNLAQDVGAQGIAHPA